MQADPGYSGLITKNPTHSRWKVLYGPYLEYELSELAEYVDLPKHLPKRKPEEIGLGRNVTVFEFLRIHAYRQIRHYKGEVRNFVLWQSHLNNKALERNGEFLYPLDGREVWHIAKSVSRWVWQKFDLAASDARFSALQAYRGRKGGLKGGVVRSASYEQQRAEARLMRAGGKTQIEIAQILGVHVNTVANWTKSTHK